MSDTKQCPNCGEVNDVGNSVCRVCHTPLTAYGGQLTGETYQGKLAAQVAATEGKPPAVLAMTIFNLIFGLVVLGITIQHFQARPAMNEEGSNAIQVAATSFGAIVWAIFLIPLALALIGLALATWTQRTWAWTANAVGLGLFAFLSLFAFGFGTTLKVICVGIAILLGIFWFSAKTKGWFGLS